MRTLESQVSWCNRVQWVIATTLLIAAVLFYVLAYAPSNKRLETLNAQVDIKRAELQANRTRAEIRHEVERKVIELKRKQNRFDKKLPRQQELDQFLRELTVLSDQSALRGWQIQTEVPQHRELLMELPLNLQFSGDFLSAFSFLRQMEQMERLTRVKALSVKGRPDRPGQVAVEVSMSIYFSEG